MRKDETSQIVTIRIERNAVPIFVVGASPLIMHRQSQKTKQELLLPARKKNKAEQIVTMKHDPLQEYRDSVYRFRQPGATLLSFPAMAFKGALRAVAVDMPGARKSEIGRLTFIAEEQLPIWGTPVLKMDTVRQGGIARTPDVRTRASLPEWASTFNLIYQSPILSGEVVVSLFAAAGDIIGVGDFRPEKGVGNFGRFRLVDKAEFDDTIARIGGAAAQERALNSPDYYDQDTQDLFEWFQAEASSREMKASVRPTRRQKYTDGKDTEADGHKRPSA